MGTEGTYTIKVKAIDINYAESNWATLSVTMLITKLTFRAILPLGMTITNVGNITARNVQWSVTVEGKFILLGQHSSGKILEPLEPGQEITVRSDRLLLGIGTIEITYAAWADNAPRVSATFTGKLLGIFFIF